MKEKATLLIQHLETIYTMVPPQFACVHHGFIAFHHEHILQVGQGEGWAYVDKDTRIIEGRNHIAIPGFIDVAINGLPHHTTLSQNILIMREQGEIRMKNATLIGNIDRILSNVEESALRYLQVPYEFDYVTLPFVKQYPIVYPFLMKQMKPYQRFCISSKGNAKVDSLDQLLCAKLYYLQTHSKAMDVLAACTIYPARCLHLTKVGSIAKNKTGNVVLMEGSCFEEILTTFHGHQHVKVIKEGTHILSNIII